MRMRDDVDMKSLAELFQVYSHDKKVVEEFLRIARGKGRV
jgi:hypothetical protein